MLLRKSKTSIFFFTVQQLGKGFFLFSWGFFIFYFFTLNSNHTANEYCAIERIPKIPSSVLFMQKH